MCPGFWTLLGVLLLFHWVYLVGVVRAEFLRGRNFEYITAARALGLSNGKIMFKHLLAQRDGSDAHLPSLQAVGLDHGADRAGLSRARACRRARRRCGELLAQGKANLQAPWLGITAFVSIAGLLSLLIFIGEGVRDALDPRKTFR